MKWILKEIVSNLVNHLKWFLKLYKNQASYTEGNNPENLESQPKYNVLSSKGVYTEISIALTRAFLHKSGDNISEYIKTSDLLLYYIIYVS